MSDRRAVPRYALSMPISVRVPELDPIFTNAGRTVEVSTRGVQFIMERPLPTGTLVDFTIALQDENANQAESFIHGSGSVSRVIGRSEKHFQVAITVTRFQISRNELFQNPHPLSGTTAVDTEWTLTGTYFETCNCDVACQCIFLSPPTTGECTCLIGWHIEKGSYGGTILDGLNMAIAVHSPGPMLKVKWKAAVYVDDRASRAQKDALVKIFSGSAGGHLMKLATQIGELLGVKSVPIEYVAEGKRRRLRIPDVAETEIEGLPGQGENPVTILNHPFCVAAGYPAEVAKSKHMSFSDHGYKWNVTEKNGFVSRFHYKN